MTKRVTSIELKKLYPDKTNNCTGHLSKYAITDNALRWAEYGLLAYLNTFAMSKGECYISRDKILNDLNISRSIYDPALKILKEQGYITTRRCIRDNHRVYAFFLHEPENAKSKPSKVKEKDPEHPKYLGLDRFGYGQVSQDLMRSPALQYGSKCLYSYLAAKMGLSKQVHLTMEQIKREMGMSEATINKYMAELVRYDLIDKAKIRKAGKFESVLYFVPGSVIVCSPNAAIENLPSPNHKKTTDRKTTDTKQTEHYKRKFPSSKDKLLPSSALQPQSVQEKEKPTENKSKTEENQYSYQVLYANAKESIQRSIVRYGISQDTAIPDEDIEEAMMSSIASIMAKENKIPETLTKDYRVLRMAFRELTGYQRMDKSGDQLRSELASNIEDALVSMSVDIHPRKYANGLYATGKEVINLINKKIWATDTTPNMFFKGLLEHIYAKTSSKVISSLQGYLRSCIWCYLHESKVVELTRHNAEQYLREAAAGEYNEAGEETLLNESDTNALDWLLRVTNLEEKEDYEIAMRA